MISCKIFSKSAAKNKAYPFQNCPISSGNYASLLGRTSLPPPNSNSIRPAVLQDASMCSTNRNTQTDRATCVTIGRIVCCHALRCGLNTRGRKKKIEERKIEDKINRNTIRYDMRCDFNVRSEADLSQLNLPRGTNT